MRPRVRLSIAAIGTVTALATLCAAERNSSADPPAIRGTINVVLANGNGIVVLTDSRLSRMTPAGPQPLPEPGQKLFKLDDSTVCTFAGFAAAPVSAFPELADNSAAILQDIGRHLSTQGPQPFHAKFRAVVSLFSLQLDTIANLRHSPHLEDYRVELTVVGYDSDGKGRIGQAYLRVVPDAGFNGSMLSVKEVFANESVIGNDLVWTVAGEENAARRILNAPFTLSSDPVIATFAKAYSENRGASLSVSQMKDLAESLARYTALARATVGGENQIAVIRNGHLERLQQATFPAKAPVLHFDLLIRGEIINAGQAVSSPLPSVFVETRLDRIRRVKLDDNFYFATEIVNSTVLYDGGTTRFDSSNKVHDCVLILGSNARRNPDILRHLQADFVWKQIIGMPGSEAEPAH